MTNDAKDTTQAVAMRSEVDTAGDGRRWNPAKFLGRAVVTVWADRKARFGVILLALFVALAIFAPILSPYDPHDNSFQRNANPSGAHLLGTTGVGQDVLSQLIWGAQVSVSVALVAGVLTTVIAIGIGLSWGYIRTFWGEAIGFLVNLVLVIPGLPLMIVIAAYLSNGGVGVIVLVVVVTGWAWGARVLRSQTQTLRSRDFVIAAKFSGESSSRIVFREILPNMTSLIVSGFFGAATAAILGEAGLEFLGLGDPNTVSWGTMLFWAQNSNVLLTGQWVQLFAPGFMIALFAVSMTFINFGVDGLSNPRLRERKATR